MAHMHSLPEGFLRQRVLQCGDPYLGDEAYRDNPQENGNYYNKVYKAS